MYVPIGLVEDVNGASGTSELSPASMSSILQQSEH